MIIIKLIRDGTMLFYTCKELNKLKLFQKDKEEKMIQYNFRKIKFKRIIKITKNKFKINSHYMMKMNTNNRILNFNKIRNNKLQIKK